MRQRFLNSLVREQARLLSVPMLLGVISPLLIVGLARFTDREGHLLASPEMTRAPVLLLLFLAMLVIAQPYAVLEALSGALPQRWYRLPLRVWTIAAVHIGFRLAAAFAVYYGAWTAYSLIFVVHPALRHPLVPLVVYFFLQSVVWTGRRPVLLLATLVLHVDLVIDSYGLSPVGTILNNALIGLSQTHLPAREDWTVGVTWTGVIIPVAGYIAASCVLNVAALRLDRKHAGFGGAAVQPLAA